MLNDLQLEGRSGGWFREPGWRFVHGPDIAPDGDRPDRADYRQVILRARFGAGFDPLKGEERVALALAGSEGTVNHARLCTVSSAHPAELTRTLQHLTQLGMLDSSGSGRGAVYFLPGQDMPTPDDVFGPVPLPGAARSSAIGPSSSVLPASSSVLDDSSSVLDEAGTPNAGQHRDEQGYLHTDQLPLPVINDLHALSPLLRDRLEQLAAEPREKKMDPEALKTVILAVCDGHYLTLNAPADLLNRRPASLRNAYLSPMVRARTLSLAFPTTPTHERRAYCATSSLPTTPDDTA